MCGFVEQAPFSAAFHPRGSTATGMNGQGWLELSRPVGESIVAVTDFLMRIFVALAFMFAVGQPALAASLPSRTAPPPEPAPAVNRCAGYGPGFFSVKGSDTCMRIGGYVGADVGFASGGAAAVGTAPAANLGLSGDMRFNTPMGPGKLAVGVRRGALPPGASTDQ